MLITPANLNIFFTTLDTLFSEAFELAPTWQEQIATPYTATSEAWLMGWIGMLDKLRPWQGARVTHTPAPQTYGVTIQNFEGTWGIDKFKLADDLHDIYFPVAKHIGQQAKKWPDYNVRDLIQGNGIYSSTSAQTGPDGVSFWNASHPVDFYDAAKGTYCNDYGTGGVSVNGVTVGGAFATNAWATVWEDMATRKNESNEAMGLLPDMTMVPPQIHFPARTLIQGAFFAPPVLGNLGTGAAASANAPFVGAMDNPLRGSTDLMMNPDLASAPGAWYMLTTKWAIKPFGWVLRAAPVMVPRLDPTDPVVFETHTFVWGCEARGVAAWGLPFLASRSGI
jgi:phage major head subunit gpT-like protein